MTPYGLLPRILGITSTWFPSLAGAASGSAEVVLQQPAESFANFDVAGDDAGPAGDQLVVDPLMGALAVVMTCELTNRPFGVTGPEQDESVQALRLDREDEAFGENVWIEGYAGLRGARS